MARACTESTGTTACVVIPLLSAPTMPGSSSEPGRPCWKVADLANPSSLHAKLEEDRKMAGSTNGSRTFAFMMAGWRRSRLAKRLALQLARIRGLS